ncbi:oxidoreductase [Pedobacter zeae]|uniref:NAD(P)-dependent dehydrogenase (Short-subunit alcohol dehydrogenase family) n=1 Tax=Pedobacter zeae TaxID=1737356 RepID=A0A7W6K8R6_9SPHI|nr:oxidoreductase [Pedobacter zeae]MBB4106220.1 NAD(P)-dependent dehydrogenase (short-subunit alcohol dehydrogenase family) [Pedobacter zeae]GGH00298.1 putative short-chain dehydrogenase/reductase [Pedobacter zeae]
MWTNKNINNQSGRTFLITGANSGIGYETAKALYQAGAHIIMACRDFNRAEEAAKSISSAAETGSLEIAQLNLSNLSDVKDFADQIIKKHNKIDVLINNAGVMIPPASKTSNGFELQFGVNFIGHYALTGYLYPLLKQTANSRIVTVSSMAYLHGKIDFDNLKSERDYEPMREYAQSKLANILFSLELQRRIETAGDAVVSIAAQPGANKTELSRHMSDADYQAAVDRIGELMEPWQGALPSLFAAVSAEAIPGKLYGPDQDGGYRGYPAESPITPHGTDVAVAKQLWDYAEQVTRVTFP